MGQEYGSDPVAVRETDQYKAEYIQEFVAKWDELIDWGARRQGEGDFFIQRLKERGAERVLDVATGTGFHSVRLLEEGFQVVSADGSAEMLARAFANGRRHDFVLSTVRADWRWLNRDVYGRFDAVICLGNSFTHLFSERARRKALAEFYSALRHDGVLILDQRNYDALLDGRYESKHEHYYCGDVNVEPEHVDDGLARFRYAFRDGSEFHLNMFPLRAEYVRRLMQEVGFQRVSTYSDFEADYDGEGEPDFLIHVAEKQYRVEDE